MSQQTITLSIMDSRISFSTSMPHSDKMATTISRTWKKLQDNKIVPSISKHISIGRNKLYRKAEPSWWL